MLIQCVQFKCLCPAEGKIRALWVKHELVTRLPLARPGREIGRYCEGIPHARG
jgi:hypothetical protein